MTARPGLVIALLLVAVGIAASVWPAPRPVAATRAIRPLPNDLCAPGRSEPCLSPGYDAAAVRRHYRLDPDVQDRIAVRPDGGIAFDGD